MENQDRRVGRGSEIPTFRLKPLLRAITMDMSKFKDRRVHHRNSGVKGLNAIYRRLPPTAGGYILDQSGVAGNQQAL